MRSAGLLLCFIMLGVVMQSCLVGRFVWYNFSDITDHRIFPDRPLPKSQTPFHFTEARAEEYVGRARVRVVDSLVEANNSVAFLIIRNDSILFERYYRGYAENSIVASFSMAKSYTSALVGAAIQDGFIKSVDEPITQYLTELRDKEGFDKITIRHLLQMTSGIKANESYYNPFGQAARLYYGRRLRNYLNKLKVENEPGKVFAYRSVNTQVLGFVVERATGKAVTEYLHEKIWSHLGSEYDASWSLDKKKNGMEKSFCCINARARDFAKFGRLYLNGGNWNGKQLLTQEWVAQSTTPDETQGGAANYKYQWWITKTGYLADGLHGQYIYVNPAKNLIIVRLGESPGKVKWPSVFDQLAGYL